MDSPKPYSAWLAAVRSCLAHEPYPGEWTDDEMRRYYFEDHSPQSAAAELAFRTLAAS